MPVRANILSLQRRRKAGAAPAPSRVPIFEWNLDNVLPTGSYTNLSYDFGATRSNSSPIEGTYSLDIPAAGFAQVQIYNWAGAGHRAWAPTTKGEIEFLFKYSSTWAAAAMLMQMDGKYTGETFGSDEGISAILANASTNRSVQVGILGTTIAAIPSINFQSGQLYKLTLIYDQACTIDGFKSLKVLLDGVEKAYAIRPLDTAVTAEWYHISYGNDKSTQMAFQLDALKIYDTLIPYVAPDPVVLINEGFEGGVIPSGWVAQSSNLAYNYSPAITGNYSCRMAFNAVAYKALPANYDFVEARFRLRIETLPSSTASVLELRTADDATLVAGFGIFSSGSIGVRGTTNSSSSLGTMATATDYYCWLSFQSGVLSSVAFSTTPTRPRSGDNFVGLNLGITTNQVGRLTLRRSQGVVCVLDDIYVASTPIA